MGKYLDPIKFADWLGKQADDKCGYLMGAVGQKTKSLTESSWLVQQYKGSAKQFKQAKAWLKTAPRVFDCQGLADCYLTEMLGKKVDVRARNNYANWCTIKGKGKIPKEMRVPGAAVYMLPETEGYITHVGFLWKPVKADKPAGDWYVVEARGVMHGVVVTRLNDSKRAWNRWGLMDVYFDYTKALELYQGQTSEPDYALGDRTLKKGRTGNDVRMLQELLGQIGYEVAVDGKFGDLTAERVKEFKTANGLTANGVYGSAAHTALMEAIEDMEEDGEDEMPAKKVVISEAGTWNVRKGPGTGYGVITVTKQGAEFEHISTAENGWIQIQTGSGAGWVSPKCARVE